MTFLYNYLIKSRLLLIHRQPQERVNNVIVSYHYILDNKISHFTLESDLEKAGSGVSGACGHFVGNPAILRTF